ncbi:hypothetical protein RRG08_027847 [Elysia crispata]|uniref:Uncharacterized protein n=1 Tax=Elysia crispata TaxID=231223 RepID=A0AAE1D4B7_9GAST|nr:hypothetical protein RRG08_027847 [Elysia crispata]
MGAMKRSKKIKNEEPGAHNSRVHGRQIYRAMASSTADLLLAKFVGFQGKELGKSNRRAAGKWRVSRDNRMCSSSVLSSSARETRHVQVLGGAGSIHGRDVKSSKLNMQTAVRQAHWKHNKNVCLISLEIRSLLTASSKCGQAVSAPCYLRTSRGKPMVTVVNPDDMTASTQCEVNSRVRHVCRGSAHPPLMDFEKIILAVFSRGQ